MEGVCPRTGIDFFEASPCWAIIRPLYVAYRFTNLARMRRFYGWQSTRLNHDVNMEGQGIVAATRSAANALCCYSAGLSVPGRLRSAMQTVVAAGQSAIRLFESAIPPFALQPSRSWHCDAKSLAAGQVTKKGKHLRAAPETWNIALLTFFSRRPAGARFTPLYVCLTPCC